MHKLKRLLIILISSITIFVALVIIFISPITKYLVQKYDEKYTGRQIKMSWAYVNPFTGNIYFKNLKVYELKSDSVFFSADGVGANIAMLKLFSKTYEISKITLNHPRGAIIQNKKDFNLNDLITRFSSNSDTTKAPVHFNILRVRIIDGEFYYHEQLIPINYFIKNVNIESSGKRWDADTIAAQFSFLPGIGGGDVKGNLTINLKNMDYRYAVVAHKFDLNIIAQYLKALTNYGRFSANLDADFKAKGNLRDQENLSASGQMAINEFHFGKTINDDYASFDKLVVAIIELNPKNHKYLFDSIAISHPYFKYERYDYLDNIETMFGKNGVNVTVANADKSKFNLVIEIAKYVKVLSKNFFQSDYKINRLVIYRGNLKFNDFSTSEKFALELSPLNVISDSIDKNRNRVSISFKSDLKPYGNLTVDLSVNPKDSGEFDLNYNLQKLPVSMFNPYTISYTSFPLDRGTLELMGKWKVRNGRIKSNNHLVVIDPRVAKRIRNKDNKWIPLPLIMFFVRERGNVIDYEIPITGNLKDPKFHFWDVIFDVLGNIFIKPPTTPYRMKVDNVENEIEKSLTLKWEMRLSILRLQQKWFIERMADFLEKNPQANITIYPQQYEKKEKEYILFFEAKKKYFLLTKNIKLQSFNASDSEMVDKMSVKDSSFVNYLNRKIKDSNVFTIQEKCSRIVDSATVNVKFDNLKNERKNVFVSYFIKRKVEGQLKIHADENVIPYNGFSFYKIEYEGEFPKFLIRAYQQMNELNNEFPRNKFKKARQKNDSEL